MAGRPYAELLLLGVWIPTVEHEDGGEAAASATVRVSAESQASLEGLWEDRNQRYGVGLFYPEHPYNLV